MREPILFGYDFDSDGGGVQLNAQEVGNAIQIDPFLTWVHLDAKHIETKTWLKTHANSLDEGIINSLVAAETRPRITEINEGFLIVLHGVNLNKDAKPEDMVSIRMWIDQHRIISTQRRNLKAIEDILDALAIGHGPKNSADFLSQLTTRLYARMEPSIRALDDNMDRSEEIVLDRPQTNDRHDIVNIRKKALIFRRFIAPQRDAIAFLRSTDVSWMDVVHKRQLQENLDRLTRYVEELDSIRERAQIIKEELSNTLAARMNKNIYALSVLSSIFLPLTFLTGLLGINVGGIPGANTDYAFWIVCGLCITFMILIFFIFKRLKLV